MHFDKKSYLYRIIKVSAIVVTALLSVALIYAAYSGTTHPADSRIAPVAVLAFPFLLALEVMIGMLWLIVHSWRVSLIVWVAILISWPSVRVVAPLNMFPHTYTPKEDSTKFKLQIEEGEYVAIMGPSGSGKTTLMNIVGCLDLPTSGTYILDGRQVSELKEKELTRVRRDTIGFVFQNFQLMPRESALDNVCLPLIYAGVSKKDRRQMGMEALERVGLSDRADFKPTQLSGGQKQRVAIARAMVNHPKLLLADEPTGALDSKSGRQVLELFESLNESGVTVVMITHDRKVAEQAKRIVHIIDGEITEEGQEAGNEKEKEN